MQERQFPPSQSEQQSHAEREAQRRVRARRLTTLAGALGTVALACLALGCPQAADLENANSFPTPGYQVGGSTTGGSATAGSTTGGTAAAGTAAGGSAAGTASTGCELPCVTTAFATAGLLHCTTCHSKTTMNNGLQSAGLDLESPNVTARLKNVPAKHTDIMAEDGKTVMCPSGDKLIDTTTPANSWLLKKIHGTQDSSATTQCGTSMPQGTTLPADSLTCLDTYVTCVANSGGGGAPATGGAATGGSATGGGGAATGGGGAATGGGGAASGGGGNGGAGGK